MTLWKVAMICLLVFGLISHDARWHRLRVGLTMFASSFIATLFPNLWFYLALDIAVAFIILLPPRSVWQRAIGACYAGMALLTAGFIATLHIFSSAPADPEMLMFAHAVLFTWPATALLFLWGLDGLLGDARPVSVDSGNQALVQRTDT